jgi:phosphohistidine phosphatase
VLSQRWTTNKAHLDDKLLNRGSTYLEKQLTVTIHFLRHAKTNQVSSSGRDFDRELLPRGYEQLKSFCDFATLNQISIEHIYCSSAKRTRQTLSEITELFQHAAISFHDELYLASKSELLSFISTKKTTQTLLIIGHNEGLSDLISYLSNNDIHLKTCGYIQLSFPFEHSGYFSAGTGSIVETFRVV